MSQSPPSITETARGTLAEPGLDGLERRVRLAVHADDAHAPKIGRLQIRERLGGGAMGIVYAAYDAELDRRVAVKLLRSDHATALGRARMRREAQALARLRHPNIVAVHDVGEAEGRDYVAMELVDGVELGAWLVARPRAIAEVLRVFDQAASALAAAHAAGIVHRDFKPANVLVDREGQVRVADFGVAQVQVQGPSSESDTGFAMVPLGDDTRTAHGAWVGTPAYMAPEQLRGEAVDARADQFAFCVSLFEAIHGVRPFAGRTVFDLQIAVREGTLRGATASGTIERRVTAVVRHGLAFDPHARWSDMEALRRALHAAARRPGARRRIAATIAVGAIALVPVLASHDDPCAAAVAPFATQWSAESRADVESVFAREGYGADAPLRVHAIERLEAYAVAGARAGQAACRAAQDEDVGSDTALRRQACLDRAEDGLALAVDRLREADGRMLTRALDLLPDPVLLDVCSDAGLLAAAIDVPADPAARAESAALLREVLRARALRNSGAPRPARELLLEVDARAERLGHAVTSAEVDLEHALTVRDLEGSAAAIPLLQSAVARADRGRADLTRAWAGFVLARQLAEVEKLDLAEQALAAADAAFARVGLDLPTWSVQLAMTRGSLAQARGDHETAARWYQDVLSRLGEYDGDLRVQVHINLALSSLDRGEHQHAREHLEDALAWTEQQVGSEHPDVARILVDLGATQLRSGDLDAAEASYRRALAIKTAIVGRADDRSLRAVQGNLASVAYLRGDTDGALATWQAMAAHVRGDAEPDEVALARLYVSMSMAYSRKEEHEQAIATAEDAVALRRTRLGADAAATGDAHVVLANACRGAGRWACALEHAEAAVTIGERVYGPAGPSLIYAVTTLGDVHRSHGDMTAAVPVYERAVALSQPDSEPEAVAAAEFGLARALRATGGSEGRVDALVDAARGRLEPESPRRAEIDRFIAQGS